MLQAPTLTTRSGKGAPLTNDDGDNNFTAIQSFCNAVASLIAKSFNDDGTPKFYNVDVGGVNDFAISPNGYLQAYTQGVTYIVKALNGNTGDSTLRVASSATAYLAQVPLRRNGQALQQGDIVAGQCFAACYDTNDKVFNIVAANSQVSSAITATASTSNGSGDVSWYTPADIALRCAVLSITATPNDGDTVSIGGTTYTFKTTLDAAANHVSTKVAGVASAANATTNLIKAINASGVAGTDYGTGTVANTNVAAVAGTTTTTINITPLYQSTSGTALALTESTNTARMSWNIAALTAANPILFQHGFQQAPSGANVSLICISADQGFSANQTVPAREFFNASNQPAFVSQLTSSTIAVTQSTGAIKVINSSTGTAGQIDVTKWRLRISAYVVDTATIFDSIALPNAAHTDVNPFAHGFPTPPIVLVGLVNDSAENGFLVGDFVPYSQFFDASGDPAFSVKVDATNITLHQNTATPQVLRLSDGTAQNITPASWHFQVIAFSTDGSSSTVIEPALELAVANPDGAIGWNGNILILNYARFSGKTLLSQFSGTTNNVQRCQTFSPPAQFANIAPFRFSDGSDRAVWTSSRGVITLLLNSPTAAPTIYGSQDLHWNKPVWVSSLPNPEFFIAGSEAASTLNGFATNAIQLLRVPNTNGTISAATTQIGANVASAIGGGILATATFSQLDLTNSNIANVSTFTDYHAAAATVLLFQYNPVSGRIYIVTAECGYLFIFKYNGADKTLYKWWPNSADSGAAVNAKYANISCDKIIALPGGGALWANAAREHIAVEYDLTTGQERTICYCRTNLDVRTGSVTRINWRE